MQYDPKNDNGMFGSGNNTNGGDQFDPLKVFNRVVESVTKIVETGVTTINNTITTATSVPLDMYETEAAVVIKAGPIHGIQPEDLDVTITLDSLTIKGESKPDPEIPETGYLKRERRFGSFSRTVKIPRPIKADQAQADFKNGVLIITLPKIEEVKPKTINVNGQ